MSAPGTDGGPAIRPGVRLNRGDGAGCVTPPWLSNVPLAALCGCPAASSIRSTGATHASVPSKSSAHSARVRVSKTALSFARICGQRALSSVCAKEGSSASPATRRNVA